MKRAHIFRSSVTILYPLFLLLLTACGERGGDCLVEGKFKNINQGEFYIYSFETGQKDTIAVREGKFIYRTPANDTTVLLLLFPNFSELPIVTEPGGKVKIEGDVSHLKETEVTGTDYNEEMTAFRLQSNEMMPPEVKKLAKDYIMEHPKSALAPYLLRRYFILAVDADLNEAFELCGLMMKAKPNDVPMIQLYNRLKNVAKIGDNKKLPHFEAVDTKGKKVTDSLLNAKYNVITVWGSWNSDSQTIMRRLRTLQKDHPQDLKIISIALDTDSCEGKRILKRDSIEWQNICDGKLWDSPLLGTLCLAFVPDNIVTDAKGNIKGRSLKFDDIKKIVETP